MGSAGSEVRGSLGYGGDELEGQWRIRTVACMSFMQIASGGGLLRAPICATSIENWPAMRHEIVVDFTKYLDGTPTKKGDVIYLANICKMADGRKRTGLDPKYKIPLLKIVIGDDAPDNSVMPTPNTYSSGLSPPLPAVTRSTRTFELQRGRFGGEIQWLINGHPFDPGAARHAEEGRRDLDDQERRRRLDPPDAPPHGGAPRAHAEREAGHVGHPGHQDNRGRTTSSRWIRGRRWWSSRRFRTFTGNLRGPLPQPGARGPQP